MATTKKNLLTSGDVYNAYYGDFRGIDLSSDHTQVHKQRLAYAVNMFKDYQSGQGQALETIPGFRRRFKPFNGGVVYGIHRFQHRDDEGTVSTKVLIHAGSSLCLWRNYPNSTNIVMKEAITLPNETTIINDKHYFKLTLSNVSVVRRIETLGGITISSLLYDFDPDTHELSILSTPFLFGAGDQLYLTFLEGVYDKNTDLLFSGMNAHRSVSFVFNNRLYLIDGKNYLAYDGESVREVKDLAYIPTTHINIIPSRENADIGTEYEQRNILQPKFKHTFIADGVTTEFCMNENALEEISEVKVYGEVMPSFGFYEVDLQNGKVIFEKAPQRPEEVEGGSYPEFYAGIEITAKKTLVSISGVTDKCADIGKLITDCTIATVFDNRIFLSGNPNYPNHIFYCGRNSTGYADPTFFGTLNYMQDGVGVSPITGMVPVADTLMILKGDAQQDGAIYFHSAVETGEDLQPKIYPSTQGLSGIGCLGACVNFLDDPVFVSRLGVEAVGQLSVRYERAVEHRSSLIDAKLLNLDLSTALLEEWNGYLMLLVDGKIFMADSRQKYTHDTGVPQYEWYYIEGVGVYQGQYTEYRYSTQMPSELQGARVRFCAACQKLADDCTCDNDDNIIEIQLALAQSVYDADTGEIYDLTGEVANAPDEHGKSTVKVFSTSVPLVSDDRSYSVEVCFVIHEVHDGITGESMGCEAFLCDTKGNMVGGVFKKATVIKTVENNLFFGTEDGTVCSFNFDMRDESGAIPPKYYNFDGRTIFCGCATKMDCCDIPHLTKNTVKKSTVIKTKSLQSSAAKIKVRTNKKPYEQIARINGTVFSFDDMDFSDFSFDTAEQSLFSIREKEKKWVEKQYFLYSDEYQKPFALYYISFRYTVAGRYKE